MEQKEIRYPLLMYDGVCGFCDRVVQLVLRHDRKSAIYFIPRQSPMAGELRKTMQIPDDADSVIFVDRDSEGTIRPYLHSTAVLKLASRLGGLWKLVLAGYVIPQAIRDWMYRKFAKNRYRIFGRSDQCIVPSREYRSRFLESEWENPGQELK